MPVDENLDLLGREPQNLGSVALKPGAPLSDERASFSRRLDALRIAGTFTQEDRELLEDADGFIVGEEGSISQLLFERIATMEEAEARAYLESIYSRVMAPLHLRAVLPTLIEELEYRRMSGVKWVDLTEALAIEVPVDGHAVTVVDANGYTACLLKGQYDEKVQTATAIAQAFDDVARKTGVLLLEPVVGDAALFLSFNPNQQSYLEQTLAELKIPMNVQSLAGTKTPEGEDRYPKIPGSKKRHFTLSRGVFPVNEPLKVMAYGGKGNRRGGVLVHGAARDSAVELQKHASAGALLKHDSGSRVVNGEHWNQLPQMPKSNLIAIKAIEAVLQMTSYSEAALPTLLNQGNSKLLAPRLDAYYSVVDLQGGDVHAFWENFVQEGTGTPHIVLFKPVGMRELHFWSKNIVSPGQFREAFSAFIRQMKSLAAAAGITFKVGLGHEVALELLHLPGSFQADATGEVIVGTVRASAALAEREGDCLNVDQSACAALGLSAVEFSTQYIKGVPYAGVHVDLDEEGNFSLPEPLLGREKDLERIHAFIDQIGVNGVSLGISKPATATDSGWGESALLRAAEHYARTEKGFSDQQIVHVRTLADLDKELLSKLGCGIDGLIEDPTQFNQPILLLWDADHFDPLEGASMNRFLSALAGAPLAMIHAGEYRFRPEMSLGDRTSGRELSAHIELEPLTEDEAVRLVFQTRRDLEIETEARVRQLLREWGKAFVPRPLIHTFSRALKKVGANIVLDDTILEQIWTGELSQILDIAGYQDEERVALGIIAEIGLPIPLEDLQLMQTSLDWPSLLPKLLKNGVIQKLRGEDGQERISVADPSIRKARLLARSHKAHIRDCLKSKGYLDFDPALPLMNFEDGLIALEHNLADPKYCREQHAAFLVQKLGRHPAVISRGFGSAYTIYCEYLDALARHKLGADELRIPAILAKDLIWAFTQTGHPKDLARVRFVLSCTERPCAELDEMELTWREHGRMKAIVPTAELTSVPDDHPYAAILASVYEYKSYFESQKTADHDYLDSCLKLSLAFDEAANFSKSKEANPTREVTYLAFKAAALARRANASRILNRLATILEKAMPWNRQEVAVDEDTDLPGVAYEGMAKRWIFTSDFGAAHAQDRYRHLAINLRNAAHDLITESKQELHDLEALALQVMPHTDFQRELIGETDRFLADSRKYLFPIPNDLEFLATEMLYAHAEEQLSSLERPLPFAGLDSADVRLNYAALYLERKLLEPGIINHDELLRQIQGYMAAARTQLELAVQHGMLPYRHRLKIQLMNFIELEYRLRLRIVEMRDKPRQIELEEEYKELNRQTAQLHELIHGKKQVDYYAAVFLPLKNLEDERNA